MAEKTRRGRGQPPIYKDQERCSLGFVGTPAHLEHLDALRRRLSLRSRADVMRHLIEETMPASKRPRRREGSR